MPPTTKRKGRTWRPLNRNIVGSGSLALALEGFPHCVVNEPHGGLLHPGQDVAVQVEGDRNGRVPKPLLGDLWMDSLASIWVAWLCLKSWNRRASRRCRAKVRKAWVSWSGVQGEASSRVATW